MSAFRHLSLHARFLLGLSALMVALGAIFAVLLYFHLRHQFEAETEEKASLILAQAEAVQGYVRKTLRPVMYGLLSDEAFVMEAMSTSYVTRKIMSDLNLAPERYLYRRVSENARNPDFEADALERGIIDRFRSDPNLRRLKRLESVNGEERFVVARAVVFEASCMHCHGDPAEAPRELLARYGDTRGFWRQEGELAGVDVVSMPVSGDVMQIRGATTGFVTMFGLGMLVVFILIQFFFDRLVVHNLGRVSEVMRRHFPREADAAIGQKLRVGEIEELLSGIEAFATHLGAARAKLEDYAANLERMVGERTEALSNEAGERRADVGLFVELLNSLNQSQTRAELLKASLAMIGRRFAARRVSYVCTMSTREHHSWPGGDAAPELPPDWTDLVSTGATSFLPGAAYVPVVATDMSRGLLCLFWDDRRDLPPQTREVLRAIGQQLGIAMENLDALDNLIRQNLLLGSIFEGISDPLFLIDDSCRVITANASAVDIVGAARALSDQAAPLSRPPWDIPPGREGSCRELGRDGAEPVREMALPDGRSFSVHVYPLKDEAGQPGRAVVYLRENTAEKRMLANMRQNEKIVAVGRLAAGLAHEINNPLGVIRCYAELLSQGSLKGQERADLEVIVNHVDKAKKVLRDLLDFARPRQSEAGPCDTGDILANIADIFQVQAQSRRAEIHFFPVPDLPPVLADPSALEQVAANLILNALDAVPDTGGRIEVRVWHDHKRGQVVMEVADNGPGVPEDNIERIFDPFFTTKEVGRGTGLGLAVVYGLVRDMGGSVEVANNRGAVFRVRLPAMEANGEALAAGSSRSGEAA